MQKKGVYVKKKKIIKNIIRKYPQNCDRKCIHYLGRSEYPVCDTLSRYRIKKCKFKRGTGV